MRVTHLSVQLLTLRKQPSARMRESIVHGKSRVSQDSTMRGQEGTYGGGGLPEDGRRHGQEQKCDVTGVTRADSVGLGWAPPARDTNRPHIKPQTRPPPHHPSPCSPESPSARASPCPVCPPSPHAATPRTRSSECRPFGMISRMLMHPNSKKEKAQEGMLSRVKRGLRQLKIYV